MAQPSTTKITGMTCRSFASLRMTASPGDRALLARIHVFRRAGSEKKRLHVLRQEAARLRIHHVESVVVDQHRLLLHPQLPALLADLGDDSGANLSRKW